MQTLLKWLFFLAVLMMMSPVLNASPGNPDNWCRNVALEGPGFRMAQVTGAPGEKIYFYGDDDANHCPNLNNPLCKEKAYLVPGDTVIVSRTYGDFLCSWYQNDKREWDRWLPARNLKVLEEDKNPPLGQWVGRWVIRGTHNELTIQADAKSGRLHVEGSAEWGQGMSTNVGQISSIAPPQGNRVRFVEGDPAKVDPYSCMLSATLTGSFLIASDNHNCGGMNVNFDGIYQKKSGRK